jgi:hypothetical protein
MPLPIKSPPTGKTSECESCTDACDERPQSIGWSVSAQNRSKTANSLKDNNRDVAISRKLFAAWVGWRRSTSTAPSPAKAIACGAGERRAACVTASTAHSTVCTGNPVTPSSTTSPRVRERPACRRPSIPPPIVRTARGRRSGAAARCSHPARPRAGEGQPIRGRPPGRRRWAGPPVR